MVLVNFFVRLIFLKNQVSIESSNLQRTKSNNHNLVNEIKNSKCQEHLIVIFSWMLSIGMYLFFSLDFLVYLLCFVFSGNYLNGGTNKGQAHGIKLSGLV